MEWTEVKIFTTTEGIEPVSAVLMDTGIDGIQVEDDNELKEYLKTSSMYWDYADESLLNKPISETTIKVYVSKNPYGDEILYNIKDSIDRLKSIESMEVDLGRLHIEITENLDDEEWLNKWKEHYKPFCIGEKVLIKPVWEELTDEQTKDKVVFTINPGHVFGTGLHQTTRLCITELEKYVNNESTVLDLGCGSGILSIISLILGSKSAFAVDIDENAVKVAYENAQLNNICNDKYYVTSGNILNDPKLQDEIGYNKYNIVLANIIADVICELSPLVKNQLSENGVFITSGIIKDRIDDVYTALKENDLSVIDTFIQDEWVCIVSKKG